MPKRKTVMKQELLLRRALVEKGFKLKKLRITINHKLGRNTVNGIDLGIIYPDSFFSNTLKLFNTQKKFSFYFNGNMSKQGGRKEMLSPFLKKRNSRIVESNFGRIVFFKGKFNKKYFKEFSSSKFGLCPNQKHWDGEFVWTYRFIESCMCFSIPVLFKETPLSKSFVSGSRYLWDEDLIILNKKAVEYNLEDANYNYFWAKNKFTLSDKNIKDILKTII